MIRLFFVDTYCNSLQQFRKFLVSHAGEEKNRYHVSVAEKFRSGLIEQWLVQEQGYQMENNNESEVSILTSLIEAVRDAKDNLDSDSDIYAWIMQVFCSQSEFDLSLNPFKHIDVKQIVTFYNANNHLFKGRVVYKILYQTNESIKLNVSLNGVSETLVKINLNDNNGVVLSSVFEVKTDLSVTGNNILDLAFSLENYPITSDNIYVCIDSGIEDVYVVSNRGRVCLSTRNNQSFSVKRVDFKAVSLEVDDLPQDLTWAYYDDNYLDVNNIENYGQLVGIAARPLIRVAINRIVTGKEKAFEKVQLLKSFSEYCYLCENFTRIGDFNNQGVAIAKVDNKKDYFVFCDGRVLMPFFKQIWLVGEGLAAIRTSSNTVVFVSMYGDEIIQTQNLSEMSVFSEGFLAVRRALTGDWGYMKKDGTILGSYAKAGDFRNGQAIVFRSNWIGDKWFIIDSSFNEMEIDAPSDDVVPTKNPENMDGMHIEKSGGVVGLYTDDLYPVPVTFNLPKLKEITLFEI